MFSCPFNSSQDTALKDSSGKQLYTSTLYTEGDSRMANWNVLGESPGFILGKSDRCGVAAAASFLYKSTIKLQGSASHLHPQHSLDQDRTSLQVSQKNFHSVHSNRWLDSFIHYYQTLCREIDHLNQTSQLTNDMKKTFFAKLWIFHLYHCALARCKEMLQSKYAF